MKKVFVIITLLLLTSCEAYDFDKGDEVIARVSKVGGNPCRVTITQLRGNLKATVATIDGCTP